MLCQLIGAQPDDRQHTEQAKPQARSRGTVHEHNGHRHDADVDAQVGDR